jgi:hypothetical protein
MAFAGIRTLVSRRPPVTRIMKCVRQRWTWWGARAVHSRMHTKFWLRLLLGHGHLRDQKWVKLPLGEVGCKNRRRMKLVLNLMQWRVLIALNMHVLYVEC